MGDTEWMGTQKLPQYGANFTENAIESIEITEIANDNVILPPSSLI